MPDVVEARKNVASKSQQLNKTDATATNGEGDASTMSNVYILLPFVVCVTLDLSFELRYAHLFPRFPFALVSANCYCFDIS